MNQIDKLLNKIYEDYSKVNDKELTELVELINGYYNGYDPILLSLTKEELIRNTDHLTRATYELTKRKGIWDTSSKHYILSNLAKSGYGIYSESRKKIFVEKNMWLHDEIELNGIYVEFKFTVFECQPVLLMKHKYGYNSITNVVEKILIKVNDSFLSRYGFSLIKDKVAIYYRDIIIINEMEPVYDRVEVDENIKNPQWSTVESKWFEKLWSEISEEDVISEPTFFENNRDYTAFKRIIELLSSAKKSLIIIDPYFDDTTLQIIEQLKFDIHIKILTSNLMGTAKIAFPKLKKERGKIELKTTEKIHDRYCILDSNKIYLLGSSINNFGNKATTIVPLNEPLIKEGITSYFQKMWN